MKATLMSNELGTRAMEALKAALHQVSTIELKRLEIRPAAEGRQTDFVVHLGVLGHNHTLRCRVSESCELRAVRKALRELQDVAEDFSGHTTPVFITPCLTPEARALCIEANTGFVDLEDNARLVLGEVFIGKRSLPRREQPAVTVQVAEGMGLEKFLPVRMAAPVAEFAVPAINAA